MTSTISLTEAATLGALRTVLQSIMPVAMEIFRAEINRVAEPGSNDFIEMTPITRARLSTNVDLYLDVPGAGTSNATQATQVGVQLDIHGPNSADNAQMVSTLLRDTYACQAFIATNLAVQILYADDPRQTPFQNGEQQWEFRWTVDVMLQANPVVTSPQDFADAVTIGLINVDEKYPPGPS